MTTIASIIGAVIVIAAVIYWLLRSEKSEAHHLDSLHIVQEDETKKS